MTINSAHLPYLDLIDRTPPDAIAAASQIRGIVSPATVTGTRLEIRVNRVVREQGRYDGAFRYSGEVNYKGNYLK